MVTGAARSAPLSASTRPLRAGPDQFGSARPPEDPALGHRYARAQLAATCLTPPAVPACVHPRSHEAMLIRAVG